MSSDNIIYLDVTDGITPELRRMLKKVEDLSPAMKEVESQVLQPLKLRTWRSSGIRSRSGELEGAVTTFHGKRSAGISVHSSPGKDLIIPKATKLSDGASRHQHRGKDRYLVKAHDRAGMRVRGHQRRNVGSPWGDITPRPFIPKTLSSSESGKVIGILQKHIEIQ